MSDVIDLAARAPLVEVESYAHADNRGTTHKYRCGCAILFRGIRMRRKFCRIHGQVDIGPLALKTSRYREKPGISEETET